MNSLSFRNSVAQRVGFLVLQGGRGLCPLHFDSVDGHEDPTSPILIVDARGISLGLIFHNLPFP